MEANCSQCAECWCRHSSPWGTTSVHVAVWAEMKYQRDRPWHRVPRRPALRARRPPGDGPHMPTRDRGPPIPWEPAAFVGAAPLVPHPALGQDLTPLLSRATPSAVSEPFAEFIGFPISQVLHHVLRLS